MRWTLLALPLIALASAGSAGAACDGKGDIEAAFLKQQKSPAWRTVIVSQSQAGRQEQTIEYIPPDRMHRKILVVGQEPAVESIGIGQWAWSNQGNGWGELQPPMAKMIAETIKQATSAPPKVSAEFSCLGTVAHEGKDYLAYQTAPETAADGVELARTIYIDPATGLPAFNIIGAVKGGTEPLHKETYTYPTDLVIEKPF